MSASGIAMLAAVLFVANACATRAATLRWTSGLDSLTGVAIRGDTLRIRAGRDTLVVQVVEPNVVRVHFHPNGYSSAATLVLDPKRKWRNDTPSTIDVRSDPMTIVTDRMTVKIAKRPVRISVYDARGKLLLQEPTAGGVYARGVRFDRADGAVFGIDDTSLPGDNVNALQDIRLGIVRIGGLVSAGRQGDGGAPLAYTTRFGLLVDSDGGTFNASGNTLSFSGDSRRDVEYFAIVGDPKATMRAVADISGHPPMMPKWSLGFLNSQWGSSQREVEQIVKTYRATQIPLDAFILDFDWKAWGEDDYGEWRWNSTSDAGNVHPDLFPGGASGAFARELGAEGVKLVGIYKPRIILYGTRGGLHDAARFAYAHHLFFSWEKPYREYFSGRPALDIDFSKPSARSWFWQHMLSAYHSGIVGFWNDEADARGGPADAGFVQFPNFQFLNMERAMYDGARSIGERRVWSINRNFYLGAQRYAYGEWSGDLETSFDSMREQAIRMLGTIDLGEPHWSMDTGGFDGHPDPELYARWMEFAAFVPIMRVHGTLGEKRQPWVYGPQAEADAKAAIDLRYHLMPYMYAYERAAHDTGVGIVRPLVWDFPDDDDALYVTDEWMFGDQLLVAPIFGEGQAHRSIYVPSGTWIDYFRGTRYTGPKTIVYDVDPNTWADIPLFVRDGAIIPTQAVEQYAGEHPVTRVDVDVFADATPATFDYYDDDGDTYAYENGAYYEQRLAAVDDGTNVRFDISTPTGSYAPPLRTYLVKLHGLRARAVSVGGVGAREFPDLQSLQRAYGEGWATATDRYGTVTYVVVDATAASHVVATR